MSDTPTLKKRLFIALWPSPETRRALQLLQRHIVKGSLVHPANLHATLAFIGTTSFAQEQNYMQVVNTLGFSSFDLRLDILGWWKKPRVLWVGSQITPPSLMTLVQQLNEKLALYGFVPEKRNFALHITLARKYPAPVPVHYDFPPISWRADTIALVESRSTTQGVRYLPLTFRHAV